MHKKSQTWKGELQSFNNLFLLFQTIQIKKGLLNNLKFIFQIKVNLLIVWLYTLYRVSHKIWYELRLKIIQFLTCHILIAFKVKPSPIAILVHRGFKRLTVKSEAWALTKLSYCKTFRRIYRKYQHNYVILAFLADDDWLSHIYMQIL